MSERPHPSPALAGVTVVDTPVPGGDVQTHRRISWGAIYTRYENGTAAILPTGLILSLIVVCILLFTGWKGWELVYRHRVGVSDQ
jgi:Predicted membrane protein (DUF2231)